MLRRLLFLALLLLPLPAFAQTGNVALDGDWNGTLDTPGGRHLHMLFRFSHADGALQAQFISVDQAGAAFPAQVTLDGRHITLAMAFGGTFDGVVAEDGKSIVGSFHQTITLPLTLVPGTVGAASVHQPDPGDLTIQTATGALSGTLLRKGPIGVVIIAGSGPNNRDGLRGTYRAMAEALAAHDITSLRFDKRGVGESAPAGLREEDLRIQTYADDVKGWAAELKHRLGARCVWLGGHSEGGELAIMAAQSNPDICGLVLFASPGRDFTVLLREQFGHQLPANLQPEAFAALDDLDAGRPIANPSPQLMGIFRPSVQPFLRSEIEVHPTALLAQLKIPVLILQGDADVQVFVADAKALAAARPDAVLNILPGVNHSQRIAATDTGKGPGPLAPGEMDLVAQFMHEHTKMKIATWNVNSIKARLEPALAWLKAANPDVVCLQEIKCVDENFPRETFESLGYNCAVHGQKSYNGVAILSKRPMDDVTPRLPAPDGVLDDHSRYLEAVITGDKGVVRVASIYAPNGNPQPGPKFDYKLAWLDRLRVHAGKLLRTEEAVVLMGDYNVIPEDKDAAKPKNWVKDALFQPESKAAYRRLLNLGYCDAIRARHPEGGLYTFWDYFGSWERNNGIRIDHILLSPQATDRLNAVGIDKDVRGASEKPSDHVPVWVDLKI